MAAFKLTDLTNDAMVFMPEIVFSSNIGYQRDLYFPQGLQFFFDELTRDSNLFGSESIAAKVLERGNLEDCSCYVTVPFDCPESLSIEDLRSRQFTIASHENPRAWSDVYTFRQTNEALLDCIVSGRGLLGIDLGYNDEQALVPRYNAGRVQKNGNYFQFLDKTLSADEILQSLTEPSVYLKYISRANSVKNSGKSEFVDSFVEHIICAVVTIWDCSGYLLWWPKS